MSKRVRTLVRVEGIVQGVGFRPFVFSLATRLGLAGRVGNDVAGVFAEVEGPVAAVSQFLRSLRQEAPPLARIERITTENLRINGSSGFMIAPSESGGQRSTLVSPDTAACDDCLRELADPEDRRFGYPFINCTNCGPRFTIVRDVPYDRALTTMAGFAMCARCAAEYNDPADRRFHAQPVCCPDSRWRRRPACCGRARYSPSRAWAAITWRWTRGTRPPPRRCGTGSTARTNPSRSWCRPSPSPASFASWTRPPSRC